MIDPCEKRIDCPGSMLGNMFMACSKLEAMAIHVVKQACGNDIMASVYMQDLQKRYYSLKLILLLSLVKGQDSQDELQVQDTAMGLSDSYKEIYLTGLEKIVLEFVIPLVTLTVLNILLLKMVRIIFYRNSELQNLFIFLLPS